MTIAGQDNLYKKIQPAGVKTSTGEDAGLVLSADPATTKTPLQFKVSAVGDITTESVELDLTGKGLTRYRFKPDADMRVVEDAANLAQAESWLQVGVFPLADGEFFCRAPTLADTWSDWYYFSDGNYLTNLWFLRDTAGTATAKALVEAE